MLIIRTLNLYQDVLIHIGPNHIIFPGEPITSDAALKGGLVSRVYESSEKLEVETERIANLIASKSSPVVRLGINNFNRFV